MRRKTAAAIIISCAMLCGCTFGGRQSGPINSSHGGNNDKPVAEQPSEVGTPDFPVFNGFGNEEGQEEFSMSYEDQIELIWNNISLWYGSFEGSDAYGTVVTDFDLNGRLEIIYQTRYGINSYYEIFEVNEAGDDLDIMNCEINSETMPDIYPGDIYAFAKDEDGYVIGFVMEDSWVDRHADGSMLVGAEKYFVTKNENDMQFEVISSYFIDYDSNMNIQTETYHYADGSDIEDWEEWNDSGKTYISRTYPDAQIVYYSIGLQTYFTGVTDSELHDGLIESWKIWHEYNDPREYYDESYAAGEGEGEEAVLSPKAGSLHRADKR